MKNSNLTLLISILLLFIFNNEKLNAQMTFTQSAGLGIHMTSADKIIIPLDTLTINADSTEQEYTPYLGLTLSAKHKIGQLSDNGGIITVTGKIIIGSNIADFDKLFWQIPIIFDLEFDTGLFAGVGFSFGEYDIADELNTKQIGPLLNMGYNYSLGYDILFGRAYYLANFGLNGNDVFGFEFGYKSNLFKGNMIKLIECPRDAMQGIVNFIPTKKADYINQLLKVGFDTLDFGSFVSPKVIPQLADTALVLNKLDLDNTDTKLSAIVINKRGAIDACFFDEITYLGFPFSISETFQQRNANSSISESFKRVEGIKELADKYNKEVLIYISMGFGNPYGDLWNIEEVVKWISELKELGISLFMLSDTVGVANPESIKYIFDGLYITFPDLEIGAHLHTRPESWKEKVEAAYSSGCKRFDGAIKGYGGCPMAKDDLVGNMPTEKMLDFFNQKEIESGLDLVQFEKSIEASKDIFKH